jgi:hypothetical protein
MRSRPLRVALAVLCAGIIGAAAYAIWSAETAGLTAATAARSFEERSRHLARALLDMKSAQPGYVAAGQGEDFWIARIDGALGPARDALADLRSRARSAPAGAEIDSASAALEDFEQMDRRAREYARSGQRLLASDLVFSDGIERLDAAVTAVDRARDAELAAFDDEVRGHRRTQLLAAAGAALAALAGLFMLASAPRDERAPAAPPRAAVEPAADLPLAPPAPRRAAAPAGPVALPKPPRVEPAPAPAPASTPAPPPSVDLPAIASLCTDLGRVPDMRGLPSALERAARLLDASGLVVWIADPDGRELSPILSHGYPAYLVSRLGTIDREAENVTAAAFRTGVVQTVKADDGSPGAIAAPLLTPSGPVGVMAAEVLHDGERHEATRAAAAIVAAQLATLLGPPSSRPQGKAEIVG